MHVGALSSIKNICKSIKELSITSLPLTYIKGQYWVCIFCLCCKDSYKWYTMSGALPYIFYKMIVLI